MTDRTLTTKQVKDLQRVAVLLDECANILGRVDPDAFQVREPGAVSQPLETCAYALSSARMSVSLAIMTKDEILDKLSTLTETVN